MSKLFAFTMHQGQITKQRITPFFAFLSLLPQLLARRLSCQFSPPLLASASVPAAVSVVAVSFERDSRFECGRNW